MTRSRFVHEDDVGQVELLPASVEAWCRAELNAVEVFAEEPREEVPGEGFVGYTGIYVHRLARVDDSEVEITLD